MEQLRILSIENKADAIVLRQKTAPFDFSRFTKKEITELVRAMRETMKGASGIGLAANQIGLNLSLFVAKTERKLHAVFNPKLVWVSKEDDEMEEGCLSIPKKYGIVRRSTVIWVEGQNARGQKIKVKHFGLLARVFQHEIDHLNGILFIDKALEVYEEKRENGNAN
jgi:peptide deformylase